MTTISKKDLIPQPPEGLSLVSRVKDWLDSPDVARLPVSCTVFDVEDSMEGESGIEDSWLFTSHGLRSAAGVAIHLSNLRPSGTKNGKGLVSSGAASFSTIYSNLNEILRRGGVYKNGAVTIFIDHDHPDAEDFLNLTPSELPWAKKAVYIDETIKDNPLLPLIAQKVNNGTLWLAKKNYDEEGNRLFSNVCLEILLKHRGTCLLAPINMGSVVYKEELAALFVESMTWLCRDLHPNTGIGERGYYLKPEDDRQVGLGIIGFSNFLAIQNETYEDFVTDLEAVLEGKPNYDSLAYYVYDAYQQAAVVARMYDMDRAFTVAPTASCSYRYEDAQGFTTSPNISPPIDYEVDRDSGTFGVQTYEYNPKCEIAKDVGWNVQWRLLNAWQRMMNATGKAHSISADIWSSQVVTPEWITDTFLPSALQTTYYRISVDNEALDKSEIVTPDSDEAKLAALYEEPFSEEAVEACPVFPSDNSGGCSSCGG